MRLRVQSLFVRKESKNFVCQNRFLSKIPSFLE
ncbi:hypothetical protein LINPERPRIM_LOCUS38654 [Linum perenne]